MTTEWTKDEVFAACREFRGDCSLTERLSEFLRKIGAVHPIDARERERAAAMWANCSPDESWHNFPVSLDRKYPSLTPPEPPPLVLSTGTWKRDANGTWWDERDSSWMRCAKVSDARALADWLAKYGTEEEKR